MKNLSVINGWTDMKIEIGSYMEVLILFLTFFQLDYSRINKKIVLVDQPKRE